MIFIIKKRVYYNKQKNYKKYINIFIFKKPKKKISSVFLKKHFGVF